MSKRSGIILAVLYTDCSAIRKQHAPHPAPDAAAGIAFTDGSTRASQAISCQFDDDRTSKSERRFESWVPVFLDGIAKPETIRLHVDLYLRQPRKDHGRLNKFLALFSRSSYFETTF
jgi:hypothetical protein